MNFIIDPLLKFLLVFYNFFGGNLGWAILSFTMLLRAILIPFTLPTMKSQKKIQALKPEMDKLKAKYGSDKVKLQQAQMKLYQENKINPLAGCVPQILQFIVLIALYQVLLKFLHNQIDGTTINTMFFGLDLAKPDKTYIIPLLSGVTQMVLSLMILPGVESHDLVPNNSKKKKIVELNKKEEGTMEMAETMQKQMIFVLPVVTTIAALQFPSGLAMYWVATTVFSIVQQWIVSGPGGLTLYINKVINKLMPKKE